MLYTINGVDFSNLVKKISIRYENRKLGQDRVSVSGLIYSARTRRVSIVTAIIEPVSEIEFSSLLTQINQKYVTFRYHDPNLGDRTITAIPSDSTGGELVLEDDSSAYWNGMTLIMEER